MVTLERPHDTILELLRRQLLFPFIVFNFLVNITIVAESLAAGGRRGGNGVYHLRRGEGGSIDEQSLLDCARVAARGEDAT